MRSISFSCLLFAVISVSSGDTTYTINTFPIQPEMSWVYLYSTRSEPEFIGDSLVTRIYVDSLSEKNDSFIVYTTETLSGKYGTCALQVPATISDSACFLIDTTYNSRYLANGTFTYLDSNRLLTENNISQVQLASTYYPYFIIDPSDRFAFILDNTLYYLNPFRQSFYCYHSFIGLLESSGYFSGSALAGSWSTTLLSYCDSLINVAEITSRLYSLMYSNTITPQTTLHKKSFSIATPATFDLLGRKIPATLPPHRLPVPHIVISNKEIKKRYPIITR